MMDFNLEMLLAVLDAEMEDVLPIEDYVEIPEKYVKLARKLAEEENDFYFN